MFILLFLVLAYGIFVYFLVSACLVPSFMRKLDVFEEVTEKSYAQQVQSTDITENRSAALDGTREWLADADSRKISVQTSDGYTLIAEEFFPKEDSEKWVLLLHGYTGWKEEMYRFAYWYYGQGYHVLVPDLRCQGESEGDFIGMGWTDHFDCELWVDYILEQSPNADIVLHGQSMGAVTALIMTGDESVSPHIKAVISDCAYTDAYSMFGDKITEWFGLPPFPFVDSACLMLKMRGGYDLRDASALKAVEKSDTPTLFIHGEEDAMISVDMAYELYEAANCRKELLIVEKAGHAQAQDKDPEAYYGAIEAFLAGDALPQETSVQAAPVPIELEYASEYEMERYDDGCTLISISDGNRFLVVPENTAVPQVENDITVIKGTPDNIYLAASAVMDMFRTLGTIDHVRLSGTDAGGWYIEEAREAMEAGDILYAGKYNAPDYELLLSEGCDLAIENMMISHSPEIKENLESFGIPVLIDRSSYEEHPLGRVEWIKLYGVLLGEEEAANAVFEEQVERLKEVETDIRDAGGEAETGGRSDAAVVFFYITSNGAANVRRPSDYIPKMIELAGGTYFYQDLSDSENRSSSMTMQIEEFYAAAKDADYIIYNSAVDGEIKSVDELLAKCSLLKDFQAVKNGRVYCTTKNLYQESMSIGAMISDIHTMLYGGDEEGMQYLYRLN